MGGVRGAGPVVIGRVCLLKVEKSLHTFEGDPRLDEPIDDPRIGVEGAEEYTEQRKTGEHLPEQQRTHDEVNRTSAHIRYV